MPLIIPDYSLEDIESGLKDIGAERRAMVRHLAAEGTLQMLERTAEECCDDISGVSTTRTKVGVLIVHRWRHGDTAYLIESPGGTDVVGITRSGALGILEGRA